MGPRLGVNIDHVATLRQARGEDYPSVVDAANVCFCAGADQITIHLREDRRHIQDTDVEAVRLVTKKYGKPLNLEMGCNDSIIEVAIATVPDWVCLVPEKREEKTTEGGLDLIDNANFNKVRQTCERLRASLPDLKISLFLEADLATLEKAAQIHPDAVEIHTGSYAKAFQSDESKEKFIKSFKNAHKFLASNKIACHAGHGLTLESVVPLLEEKIFEEYNIGHWIICQAVFDGLDNVITSFKKLFQNY